MPDIINRYLSNILTIDQVETLRNKTIDGTFNTFLNVPVSALAKITDKTKLHDEIVYKDVPNQTLAQHSDINLQGLQDGDKLEWDTTTSKWVNVQITEGGGQGDVIGGANVGTSGANVFYQENVSHVLEFSKLTSANSAMTIGNNGNVVEFNLLDGTTGQKGILQLATSGESSGSKPCISNDSRLTNARTPTTHASSHLAAGGDYIKLDDLYAPDDNTDLNASTVKHGLMMKYPNNTTQFLRADGTWQAPPAPSVGVYVIKKEVAELYISDDTTERTIVSHSVGGGTLGTDGCIRLTVGGEFANNTGSDKSVSVRIKIDNTVVWGDNIAVIDSSSEISRGFYLNAIINQAGSASEQKISGSLFISDDNTTSYGGVGGQDDDEGCIDVSFRGVSYIDWSSAHTVSLSLQMSAADVELWFIRDIAIMEQL